MCNHNCNLAGCVWVSQEGGSGAGGLAVQCELRSCVVAECQVVINTLLGNSKAYTMLGHGQLKYIACVHTCLVVVC